MECDIHLRLEIKLRKDKKWTDYYTEKAGEWKGCWILNPGQTWSDRIYEMFAVLADVRNYNDSEHLPLRGFPGDADRLTSQCYGLLVLDSEPEECWSGACSKEKAEYYINKCGSHYFEIEGTKYVTAPDYHSPNWCTTKEMEECINKVFKDEDGNWQGDYIEWLALLGAMKGYELSGEYECRAVFWFDN